MEKKQKKILMVTRPICPPWDEASKNFAYDLARKNQEYLFHLLTYGHIPDLPGNITEHPIYASPSLRMSFWEKMRLLRFLAGAPTDIDILHFLFTPSPQTTALISRLVLPRFRKEKRGKTIQTVATLNFKKITEKNVRQYLFADKIITHSDYSKNFLQQLGLQNVSRIYPGIDVTKFKSAIRNERLAEQLQISPHDRVILYTGEYTRLRASDLIADSLPLLVQRIPNFKMIFACRIKSDADLVKKTEIQRKLNALGLGKNVAYLETVPDMVSLYNLADVFIFPAAVMTGKFDIALTVLEAMATGKPVIISDIKPLTEAVQMPNSAIVASMDSPRALASKIVGVLQDSTKADKLGNAARENVREYFNIEKQAKEYANVYNAL